MAGTQPNATRHRGREPAIARPAAKDLPALRASGGEDRVDDRKCHLGAGPQ